MINFNIAYNRAAFLDFLSNKFLPNDFAENIQDTSYTHGVISKITKLGSCTDSLKKISVYEVRHTSHNDARITLSREIFRYMKQNAVEYALVAFVPKDSADVYRFSFIKMSPKDNNGRLEFENSNPKRYSFLLGVGQHTRTPYEYLIKHGQVRNLDDLSDRFSIEVLTKDFYNELFRWYEAAVKAVRFKGKDPKIEEHIIRLITRLMFVWFIKQKNLVPDSLFDAAGVEKLLKGFTPTDKTDGSYYNAILQNLFFATLNCEIQDRGFAGDSGGKYGNDEYKIRTKFRDNNGKSYFAVSHEDIEKLFDGIPFLNGGLFECLTDDEHNTDDGFSRDPKKRAFVPNNLFFAEDTGILSILKKYNWTIEENSPDDVEVALDPELLGKVFENLLGTYNPETAATARKESGSFYTPREIVQYMTDESLAEYLEIKTDNDADKARVMISALDIPDDIKKDKAYLNKVVESLENIKILDPACGSGAFPMGILNRIVEIVSKIKGGLDNEERYKLKLNLIENCIYGVDIQTIAIQISKLRFFIALVSEQEKTTEKSENYGIRPLPNLETKFVAANTLVSLNKGVSSELNFHDVKLDKFKEDLRQIRSHDMIKVSSYKQKKELRKKDETLCEQIELFVSGNLGKPNEETIKFAQENIKRIEKEKAKYTGEKFEEVLQHNTSLFGDDEPKMPLRIDVNKEKRKELEKGIKIWQEKIDKERSKTANNAQQAEVRKLIRWNPYKPTDSADFFDAQWMFSTKDGFDIVIGNPPYVQLQKFRGNPIQEVYKAQNYFSHDSMGDLYQLFYERGLDLLRDGGHLCYITSNKWLRAGYGEKSRELFSTKYNPKLLLDLGGKIFKSATVDTNILLIQKAPPSELTWSWSRKKDDDIEKMSDLIRQQGQPMKFNQNAWVILTPIEQSIKTKIEKFGTPLKDWDISINYGIKTGCNEAFIISGEKKDELISKDKKSAEIIRPILRGKDIKRYGHNFADCWLIAAHNGYKGVPRVDINKYPTIKEWFDKGGIAYNNKIYKGYEQLAKREDQGDTPYNLRSCVYMDDFSKPKIVYPETTQKAYFAFDDKGIFIDKTCFMLISKNAKSLQAILSSKFYEYAYKRIFSSIELGEIAYQYNKHALVKLPVKKLSFQEEKSIDVLVDKIVERRAENPKGNITDLEAEIENIICKIYGITEEEKNYIFSMT